MKALCAMVVLGAVAHASMPYLPLIGPPPLRTQVVKKASGNFLRFLAQPAPPAAPATATTATNSLVAAGSGAPGSARGIAAPPLASLVSAPASAQSPETLLGNELAGSILTMPTPDLLGITPQMLATYFRPLQTGTNSALLAAPFRVSFTPPLPPDKSSHAEYKVK